MMRPIRYPKNWEDLSLTTIAERLQAIDQELQQTTDRELVLKNYGFENENHYKELNASVKREDLQPVDGISLEIWVQAFVNSLKNEDINQALRITKKDRAGWEKINQEWSTRMATDSSMIILGAYTKAMGDTVSSAVKTNPSETISFEKYVEMKIAIDVLNAQGKDRQEILDYFGIAILQWLDATIFWKKEIKENKEKYEALYEQYEEQYKMKYEAGDSNADIIF